MLGISHLYYHSYNTLSHYHFHLISDRRAKMWWNIFTSYKFRLSLVSIRVIVISSSSVSINGVCNIVWSSSILNICCICSVSLLSCLVGHSLTKYSYSLHLKHLILSLFVLALEPHLNLLLLTLLSFLLPPSGLSSVLLLFLS